MKPLNVLLVLFLGLIALVPVEAAIQITSIQSMTNKEVLLKANIPTGAYYRLDVSSNLMTWDRWITLPGSSAGLSHTDVAGPYLPKRYYRAMDLPNTNTLTGDHINTEDGDVVVLPINHATFVMNWKDKWIYNDPVDVTSGTSRFVGMPRADLILISHGHGDHFQAAALTTLRGTNTVIIVPQAVYNSLPTALRPIAIVLRNGATTNVAGVQVDAIAMYNILTTNHPKGEGNGYVLTVGNRRFYMAGDTEDVPEMRALKNIDAAFICMRPPFTMNVQAAASAVREFKPKVVYPYHFMGNDVSTFKRLVGNDLGIEVRLRKWY